MIWKPVQPGSGRRLGAQCEHTALHAHHVGAPSIFTEKQSSPDSLSNFKNDKWPSREGMLTQAHVF